MSDRETVDQAPDDQGRRRREKADREKGAQLSDHGFAASRRTGAPSTIFAKYSRPNSVIAPVALTVMKKLDTFRGDNDEAWDRAQAVASGAIRAALAAAQTRPIALAVFDFELEDTTAAASGSGPAKSDAAHLSEVTNGVRELLGQSGRYHVIDVGGADAEAVKTHTLRDCGGCEAAIAEKLGADQSLIGVVRRVSRTEHTIGFQVRDAPSVSKNLHNMRPQP